MWYENLFARLYGWHGEPPWAAWAEPEEPTGGGAAYGGSSSDGEEIPTERQGMPVRGDVQVPQYDGADDGAEEGMEEGGVELSSED